MRYDIILFDLDNTIIDFDDAEYSAVKKSFEFYNILFEEKYYTSFHEINDGLWKQLEKGLIERKDLIVSRFETLFNLYSINGVDAGLFNEKYLEFLSQGRTLISGAYEVIKTAKSLGAKCYFITNGVEKIQKNRLIGQPFMEYIDGTCVSQNVNAKKPDFEFFKKAEELFNVKFNSKTLVVGDSLTSDIKGGVNFGIDTCWFNRKKETNNQNVSPTYEIHSLLELIDIIK